MLNITINGINADTYKLCVLNNNGQLMQVEDLKVDGTWQNKQIQLNWNLTKGIYRVALQSVNARYTANIFVQ